MAPASTFFADGLLYFVILSPPSCVNYAGRFGNGPAARGK